MNGHRYGAPLHSARKICPRCSTDILLGKEDELVTCTGCGLTLLYETLEHRLRQIEEQMLRLDEVMRSCRRDLAERIADKGVASLRTRVAAIEERLGL